MREFIPMAPRCYSIILFLVLLIVWYGVARKGGE